MSNVTIPQMIYGTAWKREHTRELVLAAITAGFRGIDTAAQPKHYRENLVGEGFRQSLERGVVQRKELFIQTKFTSVAGQDISQMPYALHASLEDQVRASISSSLHNFRHSDNEAPYLDCVLLHSPLPDDAQTLQAWRVLESYVPHSIKSIGISNVYRLSTLETLYAAATIKPTVVQNRFCRQTLYCHDIRRFCASHNINFQSFWTLTANPELLASRPVAELAQELNVSVQAGLYCLLLLLENFTILNGTTNDSHMADDLAAVAALRLWTATNPRRADALRERFQSLIMSIADIDGGI